MSLDRRTTIKWMFAAAASVPSLQALGYAPQPQARDVAANQAGYGTDPDLTKEWRPGGPWPLTLGVAARLTTAALCDLIIPADDVSPAASAVGVVDFIDEWISAPYPQQRADRELILPGLTWIEAEAQGRFGKAFAALDQAQKEAIANDICSAAKAAAAVRNGREVLREVPRSHRGRVLHHAGGHERHRLRGQCAAREIRRAAAGGAEEGGPGLSAAWANPRRSPQASAAQGHLGRVHAPLGTPRRGVPRHRRSTPRAHRLHALCGNSLAFTSRASAV